MKALVDLIQENTKLKAELTDARKKVFTAAMIIDSALNAGPVKREEATQGLQILWELYKRLRPTHFSFDKEAVIGWQARMERTPLPGLPLPKVKRRVLSMAFTRHPFSKGIDVRPRI